LRQRNKYGNYIRRYIDSVAIPRIAFISTENGDAFRIVADFMSVTTTRGCFFYFKNTSATQRFHINSFNIAYNGGSTSYNKTISAELRGGASEPTANNTSVTAIPMNSTIPKTASITAHHWDGVGTGMTVASEGALTGTSIFSKGATIFPINGAIILGTGGSVSIWGEAAEAGMFTVTVEGYFEDN